MKIGLVCPYNINKHGGVLEVVLALKSGLVERGHQVRIITPKPRKNEPHERPDGVIFMGTSTDFHSPAHTTTQVSSTHDNEEIDAILEAERFDILHFHEPWVPLLSRQLLQRSQAVNIATFHSKVPEALMMRTVIKVVNPYMRSVLNYLHELTAVSHAGAEYAASMTDQPITIIPNGIDLTKYQHLPKSPAHQQRSILYIGRLERRKGVKYLLKAFQLFSERHHDVELLIGGDGPDREKLELLADDLKLQNVRFLGYVPEEIKLQLFTKADLFCSPAVFGESFGIVLLEAMATGTVCVAGDNSGYQEVMQEIGRLSIVNPEDTAEFARRLELLLDEKSLRNLWQKWAAGYVKQFDYPRVVGQYEAFYQEALKRHG